MAEHVWEIGDWAEFKGVRYLVYKCDPDDTYFVTENGCSWCPIQCAVEHLPDCTGWTWQPAPKLQLREGAWYERADGKIVGPLRYDNEFYRAGGYFYGSNGIAPGAAGYNLIREVPAPAPKYRPFANAEEFKPQRDRWVTNKDGKLFGRVCTYSETDCWFVGVFGEYSGNWERCFGHIVFDDTKLPFGVEVQS